MLMCVGGGDKKEAALGDEDTDGASFYTLNFGSQAISYRTTIDTGRATTVDCSCEYQKQKPVDERGAKVGTGISPSP
jgi:hypothetical protein